MVYQDINLKSSSLNSTKTSSNKYFASVFDRFLSAILDYLIFSPIVAFCILIFFKNSVVLLKSASSIMETQGLFLQISFFTVLLFTLFQTFSVFITGATPGQKFLKLFIYFEQKPSSLFFQILFRQMGFVISILCLGLPFIAVLYHDKRRTWYDRLSESDVVTFKHAVGDADLVVDFTINPIDKRYFAVSISVVMCFIFSALLLSLIQSNQMTVSRVEVQLASAPKTILANKKCDLNIEQGQIERIKKSIALNILNLTPDECVIDAADSFFSQMTDHLIHSDKNTVQQMQSLAYFAKYYIAKKNGKNTDYLAKACSTEFQTELCAAVGGREIASTDDDSSVLSQKILIILGKDK